MRFFIICLFLIVTAGFVHADVIIITNSSVGEVTLSKPILKKIFLGKQSQWEDNSKIHVVNLNNPDVHKSFLKKYIKRSAKQYKSWWRKMLFTGKGEPPKKFDSVEELVEYVANTEGAIGYIDKTPATDKVKTISVE